VEQQWTRPTGVRRWLQGGIVILADWLPKLSLLAACALLLWNYFMVEGYKFQIIDLFMPLIVVLLVLIVLHILVALLLPMRWTTIRSEFQRQLERRLQEELENAYAAIPTQTAEALLAERRQAEQLLGSVREVADWLRRREQAASIAGLYGK